MNKRPYGDHVKAATELSDRFKHNMQQYMALRNITMAQMGRDIDAPHAHLYRMLGGVRFNATPTDRVALSTVQLVSEALDVSVNTLLGPKLWPLVPHIQEVYCNDDH